MSFFQVPGFTVRFNLPPPPLEVPPLELLWAISGEKELEVLCQVLRRNGIRAYEVSRTNELPSIGSQFAEGGVAPEETRRTDG